jgi:hypothetical protein
MEAQSRCQHVCSRALSASAKTNGKPTSHPSSRPPPHPRATAISTKASGVWGRSRSSLHVPHHTMPLCSRGHRSCRASPNPLYAGICRWPAMQHDPRRLRAPAEPRLFPKRQLRTSLSNGYLGSFANITAGNYTKSWWWPTSSTLGVPGRTLGCGR